MFRVLKHRFIKFSSIRSANDQGFTLIELLLVAAIIMFAGGMLIRLSSSITGRGQFTTTDNRITIIEAKIKQYYLAHEELPSAAGVSNNEIPVQIDALDLEQKYRLDGWGHFFQYNTSNTTPGSVTGLQDVNNSAGVPTFAASIISGGPDQNIGTNDDIITYIDLSVEAGQIVQKKLKMLMEKVATYDALFAGVDNDGVDVDNPANPTDAPAIDEDPLATANTGNTGCPPVAGFYNDPASGLPTLDSIEMAMDGVGGGNAYSCPTGNQLAFHLAFYYHLPTHSTTSPDLLPGGYDIDPWGNPFVWGYIGRTLDVGSIIDSMDWHYHKFFSSGPDQTTVEDDIIYNGQ